MTKGDRYEDNCHRTLQDYFYLNWIQNTVLLQRAYNVGQGTFGLTLKVPVTAIDALQHFETG